MPNLCLVWTRVGGGLGIFNVLTLIQGDISYEFRGQSYDIFITENSKFWETSISLRGAYVQFLFCCRLFFSNQF